MSHDTVYGSTESLEASVNQLTDENQFYFLGVLEALTYAQSMEEIPAEPEAV